MFQKKKKHNITKIFNNYNYSKLIRLNVINKKKKICYGRIIEFCDKEKKEKTLLNLRNSSVPKIDKKLKIVCSTRRLYSFLQSLLRKCWTAFTLQTKTFARRANRSHRKISSLIRIVYYRLDEKNFGHVRNEQLNNK